MKPDKKGSICIILGLVLTVSAFLLVACNNIIQFKASKASESIFEKIVPLKASAEEIPDYMNNQDTIMPTATVNGYDCIGTLEISSLNIKLPVLSEWNYPSLRVSPCRYTGSVYKNNLIICAHNYKNHFGKLKTLKIGDSVAFTDINGNTFRYKVSDIENVKPNDSENMTAGDWDLTLFTCTVGGTSRVTVRCVREA